MPVMQTPNGVIVMSQNLIGDTARGVKIQPEPITEKAFNRWDIIDDYQAMFCLTIIESAIRRARVTFVASDESGAELAKALERSWLDTVRHVAKCYLDGRAAFEILWTNGEENGSSFTIPVLEFIPPDYQGDPYSEMILDENGDFVGIKLATDKIKRKVTLDNTQSWWFGLDATRVVPYGDSRIKESTMRVISSRKELFRQHRNFMRRHAFVGGVAHVQRTVTDPATGNHIDNFSVFESLLARWVDGGWIIVSNERDDKGQYKDQIEPSTRLTDPEPLERSIAASDARLSRSMGLFDKLATEGIQNGATEGSLTIHVDTFLSMIEDIVRQAVASWNKHIAPMVAEKNSGRRVRAVAASLTNENTQALIDIVKSVITNNTLSPMILSGAIDVLGMFERVGLPITGIARASILSLLEKMREMPPAAPGSPPSGFVQSGPPANGNPGGDPDDPLSKAQN